MGDGGGGGGGGVGCGLRITIHNNLQSCQLLPILHEIPFIYVLFLCEIKKVPFFFVLKKLEKMEKLEKTFCCVRKRCD